MDQSGILAKYAKERPLIQQTVTLFLTIDAFACHITFPIACFLVIILYVTDWRNDLHFALASSFVITLLEFYSTSLMLATSILLYGMILQSGEIPIWGLLTGDDEVDRKKVRNLCFATSAALLILLYAHSYYPMLLYDLLDDESQITDRTYYLPLLFIAAVISIVSIYFVIHSKMQKIHASADVHLVNLNHLAENIVMDPDNVSLQCQVIVASVPFSALPSAFSGATFLFNLVLFDFGLGKDILPKFWLVVLRLLLKSIISSISSTISLLIGQPEIRVYFLKQMSFFLESLSELFNKIWYFFNLRPNSIAPVIE